MGLRPVALPESVRVVIAQLLHTISRLSRAKSPHALVTNLTTLRISLRSGGVANLSMHVVGILGRVSAVELTGTSVLHFSLEI